MKKLGLAHKMMLVVCLPLLALLFFSGRYVYERTSMNVIGSNRR